MQQAADLIRPNALEAWGKPSGRWAEGRGHFGDSDYGVWANIMDGQNIQTQGSCRYRDGDGSVITGSADFQVAVQSISNMHGSSGASSRLFVQVTTSSLAANTNAATAE